MSNHDPKHDDWSSSDHLLPLPEATPHNLWRMFLGGVSLGVTVMLADILVLHYLFGLETAFVTYAMGVGTIFLVTGALKDISVPMVMASITGIVIGALGSNFIHVRIFEAPSLLSGVGL